MILSCAGDVYLFNNGNRIKLYKSENGSASVYNFRNNAKSFTAENELFFKADISNISSDFLFKIILSSKDKEINVRSENITQSMLYFSVPRGTSIQGFSINVPEKTASFPVINKIDSIDSEEYLAGLKFEKGFYHRSNEFLYKGNREKDFYKLDLFRSTDNYSEIIIDFDYFSASFSEDKVGIILKDKNGEEIYLDYKPLHGSNNITINSRLLNFQPVSVEITAEKDSLAIRNFYRESMHLYDNDPDIPVKAGFGTILLADRSMWRNEKYELFSWTHFPDFLIIDTIDYTFQADMFKRLAFYVEKPGSRGIIRTNGEIEDLHGWNAHDYKAADLASFFNDVIKADLKLNPEEELLKNILLKNEVVKKDGSTYAPGNGGILSVSRESSGYLRKIFITHEGYHGVFFSSEDFRNKCKVIWDGVDPEMKKFWKLFFKYKQYDTDDHYLLVNEFMAYNLQQPVERVIPYYFDHIIPRLIKRYPDQEDFLNMVISEMEDQFLSNAEKLADALDEVTSMPAGSLILLNKNRIPLN